MTPTKIIIEVAKPSKSQTLRMGRVRFSKEKLQASIKFNIAVDLNTDCWNWKLAVNSKGYGQLWDGITNVLTHRVSYEVFKTEPKQQLVLHRCDNPRCCNPEHLFLGSYKDNLNDAYGKGRRGTITGNKIQELRSMLEAGAPTMVIAKHFGVTKYSIYLWKGKFKNEHRNGTN